MRIQELEHLTGADRATIRFYEKQELISPGRSENGYRDYSPEDAEELKKILLLRELGVTIETIRNLQLGKEDFQDVMTRQAQILMNRSERMARASAVCEVLSSAGIQYTQLETAKYHAMLNGPTQLLGSTQPGVTGRFSEPVEKEIHPWRRYFARMIDHTIVNALLYFFAVVVIRMRPVSEGMGTLIRIASWLALVPTEAALLHYFGTTPGKWIMGIRIAYYEGGRLSFAAALQRTWQAVMRGTAFGVPILTDICMLWQYCKLTGRSWRRFQRYDDVQEPTDMAWDAETETFYTAELSWRNIVSLVAVEAVCIAVTGFSAMDGVLPKYRGNDITISQFSDNYNMYNYVLYSEMGSNLLPDGTIAQGDPYLTISIDGIGELPNTPVGNFQYELEGERVTAVTMHHSWYDSTFFWEYDNILPVDAAARWMPTNCEIALVALAAAQDGMNAEKIDEFREILDEKQNLAASDGVNWSYGNLSISWKIDAELYRQSEDNGTAIYDVTLDFRIEIG